MSFDFLKWYDDAEILNDKIIGAGSWRYSLDDSYVSERGPRWYDSFDRSDRVIKEIKRAAEECLQLGHLLEQNHSEIRKLLQPAFIEIGTFKPEDMLIAKYAWESLSILPAVVLDWATDFFLISLGPSAAANEKLKDPKFEKREDWLYSVCDDISQRLWLERSWLLKNPPHLLYPKGRRKRRRPHHRRIRGGGYPRQRPSEPSK